MNRRPTYMEMVGPDKNRGLHFVMHWGLSKKNGLGFPVKPLGLLAWSTVYLPKPKVYPKGKGVELRKVVFRIEPEKAKF